MSQRVARVINIITRGTPREQDGYRRNEEAAMTTGSLRQLDQFGGGRLFYIFVIFQ